MLQSSFGSGKPEAGCDEAGRGCLAGPVVAAAVILPADYSNPALNDSKKLTEKQRDKLRIEIIRDAIAYSIAFVDNVEIDKINILNASFKAMHLAVDKLEVRPQLLLIDGNRFHPYPELQHHCIIKGDGIFMSIAAASVLAKTERDAYMKQLSTQFPVYGWESNMGYPTLKHRRAIAEHGLTPYHRLSYSMQLSLWQ